MNDFLDAADLADLLRTGRLPESWIAPPEVRELRELVRHRVKLVHLCTSLRRQVHAVLAGQGITIPVSDLFGVAGSQLLSQVKLPAASVSAGLAAATDRQPRPPHHPDHVTQTAQLTADRLRDDPGADHSRGRADPGAVFVAKIGDVHRFAVRSSWPRGPA